MKFDDLVQASGVAARQIRYLVAEGFVPPPAGGRAHARYDETHLRAIQRYERLKQLGFPPAAIRLLLDAREGIPFPIRPGITLVVAPELIGSEADASAIAAEGAAKILALLTGEAPRVAAR
jgi:DNA-binding transcriptional MerR regulator